MNKNCNMTIGAMLLLTTAFSAIETQAQTCAVPPTCESLGYDKTADECVDKAILKCPLDSSKIFCSNGAADGVSPTPGYGGGTGPNGSYQVGDVLTCNGKSIGYVIEVNDTGSSGRISSMDYENNGATYNKTSGNDYCKAKTACNLAWELVRNRIEIKEICLAKKVSITDIWSQSERYRYHASMDSCNTDWASSLSDDETYPSEIFCTAAFVTDKSSGDSTPAPTPKTYKVGDTYSVNGVAMGKVVEVDSSGQHGVLAVSMGQATADVANSTCTAKTNGGLNWGLATGRHACAIGGSTSCFDCSLHTSGGSGYCSSGNIASVCGSGCNASTTAGYVCEAPF